MKRGFKICGSFIIILGILLTCHTMCFAYSNQYPVYLDFDDCAYIEVQCNLGRGCIVIPQNYQYEYITLHGSNNIANIGTNTIIGYFIGQNGTNYDIRIQSLGVCQYRYSSGYQTFYDNVNISQIYNTNINLKSVSSSSSNRVYHFSTFEICLLVLVLIDLLIDFLKLIYARSSKYARVV